MSISLQAYLLGAGAGVVLTATAVGVAGIDGSTATTQSTVSDTPPVADAFYADQQFVCATLGVNHSPSSVVNMLNGMADSGLVGSYVHEVLVGAVTDICPQYAGFVFPAGVA